MTVVLHFDMNDGELDSLVDAALEEDGAADDVTVSWLGIGGAPVTARMIAGSRGVVAGGPIAERVFARLDANTKFEAIVADGSVVEPGTVLAEVHGTTAAVLGGERVALNFMQRLSGIASLTATFVARVRNAGIRILDTRKTTPRLRRLERYAVRAGGGDNHRFNLTDMVLIKENHIRAAGGIEAVRALLAEHPAPVAVEVEADSMACLQALLGARVDRIMLDNFTPQAIREAVEMIRAHAVSDPSFSPQIEASGGINLDNIDRFAIQGLDYISIGALTHSAAAFDISMEVTGDRER